MGGTFNPIHQGHLTLAAEAGAQYGLSEIWFMPSRRPPHKKESQILSDVHRANMVKLAIAGNPRFRFSDVELKREGMTYTADTLDYLCRRYPENAYYFILGGDSLFQIESWHLPEEIFRRAVVLAAGRRDGSSEHIQEKMQALAAKYAARIGYVSMRPMEISSSNIRRRLQRKESTRALLPKGVYEYISRHRLYGVGDKAGFSKGADDYEI